MASAKAAKFRTVPVASVGNNAGNVNRLSQLKNSADADTNKIQMHKNITNSTYEDLALMEKIMLSSLQDYDK